MRVDLVALQQGAITEQWYGRILRVGVCLKRPVVIVAFRVSASGQFLSVDINAIPGIAF